MTNGTQRSEDWERRAREDARQDRQQVLFDGRSPDRLACDTTLRRMPDGSWAMVMLGGGDCEPCRRNRVFIMRSVDQGKTWSKLTPIDLGVKTREPDTALVPSELMVRGGRCTLFVATHDGAFGNWREWMCDSEDAGRSWGPLRPAPEPLHQRTFIRNHITTRDGRLMLPFQHYVCGDHEATRIADGRRIAFPRDPRNGVMISQDDGRSWSLHGWIRISDDDSYHGWAENAVVELADGRIAMIIRADRQGVLCYTESRDGGRTWPARAEQTDIPNPGSKATLYGLGGDHVALLHNPNPRHRSPLSLWISFDGMQTWPYRRVLVAESADGPDGRLSYPDGFVSEDGKWLHFCFDDNRRRAVYVAARLPDLT